MGWLLYVSYDIILEQWTLYNCTPAYLSSYGTYLYYVYYCVLEKYHMTTCVAGI